MIRVIKLSTTHGGNMKKHFTFVLQAIVSSDEDQDIGHEIVTDTIMDNLPGVLVDFDNDIFATIDSWEICCAEGQNNQG